MTRIKTAALLALAALLSAFLPGLSVSSAESLTAIQVVNYEASASVLGAPLLSDALALRQSDGMVLYDFPEGLELIFSLDESRNITYGAVCAKDDRPAAAFLASCMAMINFLHGDVPDLRVYGQLLLNYSRFRKGVASDPFHIGLDACQVSSNETFPFVFVYLKR